MKKQFYLIGSRLLLASVMLIGARQAEASQRGRLPEMIPRRILFGNPEVTTVGLSATGRQIVYVAPYEGVLNLWVRDVDTGAARAMTHDRDRGIRAYSSICGGRKIIYAQDNQGDENWRLTLLNVASGSSKPLTAAQKGVQARFLSSSTRYPSKVLILLNRDDPAFHDVYRLDILTGAMELVEKNPRDVEAWFADERLNIVGKTVIRKNGGSDFYFRRTPALPWKRIVGWDSADSAGSTVAGISHDKAWLYLYDSRGSDKLRLLRVGLKNGVTELIAEDPRWDLASAFFSPKLDRVQMVMYQKERADYLILDQALRPDIETIRKIQKGDFSIAGRSHSDDRWLIAFGRDMGPTSYYLFERDKKKTVFLFDNRPKLRDYRLSPMRPVRYVSRDGLNIHAYLTLPRGIQHRRLPLILLVHGGPWARNGWGYDSQAQWLANRGYACLQINYRGSTGYGKRFVNLADRQWGGRMQDDLTDGARWAVKKGWADPGRLAIFGGSYGGYAALCGATMTPDLFKAAVAAVGPSNLITFLKTIPPYWEVYRREYYGRIGDPDVDVTFLKSRSPLFLVDRIRIPLLIAQGANDPRVRKEESEQIVDAMRKKGIAVEYLLFEDEGHGMAKPQNRMRFYGACERFLRRHLGGRCEEESDRPITG